MKNLIIGLLVFLPFLSHAQTREKGPWWPNETWGAEDQTGASNWITQKKIIEALSVVKDGKVYELGHVYEKGMPLVGNRSYNMYIPSWPTAGPIGKNNVVFMDDYIASEIGQVGTQYDGPGHVGRQIQMTDGTTKEVFYNGFNSDEIKSPYGLQKLGVENVKPIITKGILIDVAAYKNAVKLSEKYVITMNDVLATLKKQGLSEQDITTGDALLFNFGWWTMWPDAKILENTPYVSDEVIEWIISKKPSMVGSDTNLDGPESKVHTEITMKNGIGNLESMKFDTITKDKVYKFLFVFTPLRFKGATGSPARPIAIY